MLETDRLLQQDVEPRTYAVWPAVRRTDQWGCEWCLYLETKVILTEHKNTKLVEVPLYIGRVPWEFKTDLSYAGY